MPRNAAGVYTLPATYLAVTGEVATAAQHNDPLEDIAVALNDPASYAPGRQSGGRLCISTGAPAGDANLSTSIYFTPYKHNIIWLCDVVGTWTSYKFTEINFALGSGMTAGLPYDIFIYYNSGALTMERVAWSTTTARASAIARQDGVWVKSSAINRRYLGTFVPASATAAVDNKTNRYLWNVENRIPRVMRAVESTDSWTYTTATMRQVRGDSANQLNFVRGLDEDPVEATAASAASNANNCTVATAIGLDSTAIRATDSVGAYYTIPAGLLNGGTSHYRGLPGIGLHYLSWLEYSAASGTTTWYGDNGTPDISQNGIIGTCMA